MSMVKNLVYGFFGLLLALPLAAKVQEVDASDLVPDATHRQIAVIVKTVIERYHYKKQDLDHTWSATILDRYLQSLDPNRSFFLQSDVDSSIIVERVE